jgi:hypothetical protein
LIKALAAAGGLSLVLSFTPTLFFAPDVGLGVQLVGAVSLLSLVVWLARNRWQRSHTRAALGLLGGVLGCLALGHKLLARYASDAQSASIGLSEMAAWSVELAVAFGVGGLLALLSEMGNKAPAEPRLAHPLEERAK